MLKKYFFLCAFLFAGILCKPQYLFQVYPDSVVKWNYYFGDEFDQENIDYEKWFASFPWGRPLYSQDIIYLPENIKFSEGNLVFLLDKKDGLYNLNPWEVDSNYLKQNNIPFNSANTYGFKYTGGLLWSKQNFKYGYFEIKFKAPVGQGIWPAFWLFGGNPNYEIDFFELKGEKKRSLHVDVHCPDKCANFKQGPFGYRKGWGHWIETKKELADSFNIVSGEWTEKDIKFYLNGELIAYYNRSFDIEMGLTLGTGIAKDGKAFKPGPNSKTPFPNEFQVDYVRVWKSERDDLKKNANTEKLFVKDISPGKKISANAKASKKLKYFNKDKKKEKDVITVSVLPLKGKKVLVTFPRSDKQKKEISFFNPRDRSLVRTQVITAPETIIDLADSKLTSLLFSLKIGSKEITETIDVE